MCPMKKLDAVIFDFDGTLAELTLDFDLMKRKIAALAEAFLGDRPEPNGRPALEWVDELAAEIGKTDRDEGLEFHSRARLAITAMELDAAREGKLFPFTRDILGALKKNGVATGIITRNITPAVRGVFPDLDEYCDVFVPREDAPEIKPLPGHLLYALHKINAEPANSLMVGDHPMDVTTGKRAGTRSAGVYSGGNPRERFLDFEPDFLERDVDSLVKKLAVLGYL